MFSTVNLVMGSSSPAMVTPSQISAMKSLASSRIGHHNPTGTVSLPFRFSSASASTAGVSSSPRFFPFSPAFAAVNSDPADKQESNKYYFLVANAKFMLDDEEHFQEQLFERLRYYGERNKEQDFWLVIEPKFLEKFPNVTKRLQRPAVALVSTNSTWINSCSSLRPNSLFARFSLIYKTHICS